MRLIESSTVIKSKSPIKYGSKFKIDHMLDSEGKDVYVLKEKDFWWFYHEIQRSRDLGRMVEAMGNYIKWETEGEKLRKCGQ